MPDRSGEPRPGRDEPIDLDTKRTRQAQARAALARDYADEHHTRQARLEAIAACQLCDQDGYRRHVVCDHTDHQPANQRGIALVRAALNKTSRDKTPQTDPSAPTTPDNP